MLGDECWANPLYFETTVVSELGTDSSSDDGKPCSCAAIKHVDVTDIMASNGGESLNCKGANAL